MKALSVLLATVIAAIAISSSAQAASVDAGVHKLLPDTPNQEIQIFATGGEQVSALEFNIQIGDGGADVGGVDTLPVITNVDLITDTIFDGQPGATQIDVVDYPLAKQSTVDISGSVAADGRIATVTINTAGWRAGNRDLLLDGVAGIFQVEFTGPTGAVVPTTVANGSLTVVPEPATLTMIGLGLAAVRLRRRLA